MKKGIIMEINKDFLTLLTPDGEFLRACNHHNHYQIGQEIDFFPVVQEERKFILTDFLQSFRGKNIFVAALLCIFIFATVFSFYSDNKVYAYMSIDVNPSIELGVNEKFQVIEIIPYNDEGKQIIASIPKWKKKNIHELTSEIISEMKEKGYIKNNHAVLLATVSDNENELEKNERWKKEMAEIKTIVSKQHLELKVIEGSKEEREKAKEKGLTTGIYKENQQVKANKSTSPFKEKSEPKETSEIGNKKEKHMPPGQAKKAETLKQSKQGFEKRENKHEYKEKQVPPGQLKKKENIKKHRSSNSEQQSDKKEKPNNKKEKFDNRQNNNGKFKQNEHRQNQKNNSNKNQHRQHKENNKNGKD